ncbi:hypothetical protein EDC04DRAFT_2636899 [Pisolithus marmoratus]|nr:hypothetical protein EDC04DRAFT_2636899 [Pisolithus marmoratus]
MECCTDPASGRLDNDGQHTREVDSGSSASWIFYLVSTVRLFEYETHYSRFNQLTRVKDLLLYDGLIFFVALTDERLLPSYGAVNALSLILYRRTNVVAQVSVDLCCSNYHGLLSCQRILIHSREVAAERDGGSRSITILTRRTGRERTVELPSQSRKSQVDRRRDGGLDTVTVDYSADEELGPPPTKETR